MRFFLCSILKSRAVEGEQQRYIRRADTARRTGTGEKQVHQNSRSGTANRLKSSSSDHHSSSEQPSVLTEAENQVLRYVIKSSVEVCNLIKC